MALRVGMASRVSLPRGVFAEPARSPCEAAGPALRSFRGREKRGRMIMGAVFRVVLVVGVLTCTNAFPAVHAGGTFERTGGLPRVVVKDLGVNEDQELSLFLANPGTVDLDKALSLRIRIDVNGRKVSEFEHLSSVVIKGRLGSRYAVRPPYRVEIAKRCRVRVSVRLLSERGRTRGFDHQLEKTFLVIPFRLWPRERREIAFSFSLPRNRADLVPERVKAEVRWDGGGGPLRAWLKEEGSREMEPLLGRSPLLLERVLSSAGLSGRKTWKIGVTNLMAVRSEGKIIVQHP
jgi:hypothetical protein